MPAEESPSQAIRPAVSARPADGTKPFTWHTTDVSQLLRPGWQAELLDIAERFAVLKMIQPRSVTSREVSRDLQLPVLTVSGEIVAAQAPWLFALYYGVFRDLGQRVVDEPLLTASREKIAINLNVQRGNSMRYECHVDSNPLQGLLYATDHPRGEGGELVIAHDCSAQGTDAVEASATILHPTSGHLIFFDARDHPHYVRPLGSQRGVRVSVAMNFYTPSCPESGRPSDLDTHLFDTPLSAA